MSENQEKKIPSPQELASTIQVINHKLESIRIATNEIQQLQAQVIEGLAQHINARDMQIKELQCPVKEKTETKSETKKVKA